jgi:hypothetical protein
LLFKTNRFSRLFPTIGSQIITEPRSLEDFPCLERTSCPTDEETVAASKTIASQFLEPVRLEFLASPVPPLKIQNFHSVKNCLD